MKEQKTTVLLKNYKPSPFRIPSIKLEFDIHASHTDVRSVLEVHASEKDVPLVLDGVQLELIEVKLDGKVLQKTADYSVNERHLTLHRTLSPISSIEIATRTYPSQNKALEGLYVSNNMHCTQCEPEGFRKITYFLDRPDVMATYHVKITADQKTNPVLLGNGNKIDSGKTDGGRHWAIFHDPFPKPCYLFALVAGDLSVLESSFVTRSGRNVHLAIYANSKEIQQCEHAMESLKLSMKWDEDAYGRECDLDDYKIVVASDFNMGAMENKGLNIFNSAYVLATPESTTDASFMAITEVIGHEYFHNWTGNRVTCRDWFQLCLKEGLTVFREQEFAATLTSPTVQRIDQIQTLKKRQFPEDDGPTSHAPRPDHFVEINNFYTATVYEKGAEIVRMIKILLGEKSFREGMDLYFKRHDGSAITQEDFVKAMEDASGRDLSGIMRWYTQPGAPRVAWNSNYDPTQKTLEIQFTQMPPMHRGGDKTEHPPLLIPITLGLIGPSGEAISFKKDLNQKVSSSEITFELSTPKATLKLHDVREKPVPSMFRGLSAPVRWVESPSRETQLLLMKHDTDPVNAWEAAQQFYAAEIHKVRLAQSNHLSSALGETFAHLLRKSTEDFSYQAMLLEIPNFERLTEGLEVIDPTGICTAQKQVKRSLGREFHADLMSLYQKLHREDTKSLSPKDVGMRRLKNVCLSYLMASGSDESFSVAKHQYDTSSLMTDTASALKLIVESGRSRETEQVLQHYLQRWEEDALCLDRWFRVQGESSLPQTIQRVRALTEHPAFHVSNPNRLRSLIFAFCKENPLHFHDLNGEGYRLCREFVLKVDQFNRQIAAGLVRSFGVWKRFDLPRQELMKRELRLIQQSAELSSDVLELTTQILEN